MFETRILAGKSDSLIILTDTYLLDVHRKKVIKCRF